jgi:hypothetical protein
MNKKQTHPPTGGVSRRTGLDRRWIPSSDYQPERRRGKDRRAEKPRSFMESLELNDGEPGSVRPPAANNSPVSLPAVDFTDGIVSKNAPPSPSDPHPDASNDG